MEEELQNQTAKILKLMLTGMEKAGNIASKELPGLIEDYLNMYYIEAIPIIPVLAILTSFTIFGIMWNIMRPIIKKDPICSPTYILLIIPIFVFFVGATHTVNGVKDMIKIKTAPKAYLIEQLRK